VGDDGFKKAPIGAGPYKFVSFTPGVELMLEAQEVQRTRGLTLSPTVVQATFWVYFADQWDPKSPCHDRRVRLAANHTSDRHAIN
jgi:peptide/nickel transport system substrate-binding protein